MFIVALSFLVGCQPQDTRFTKGDGNQDVGASAGQMTVSLEELIISDMRIEYAKSGTITLESVGDSRLKIYEIGIVSDRDQVFFTPAFEKQVDLAPTETLNITVTATLAVDAPSYGELRVRSSDPDAPSLIIPLHAYPVGYVPPEDTGEDTDADTGDGT